MEPPADRVDAILNFPRPSNILELRRFLGVINYYRRYIPNAAAVQAPVCELLKDSKKNDLRPINWTETLSESFTACKEAIAQYVLLNFPDIDSEFALYTDASDVAVGAHLDILVNGEWKPTVFFSAKLKQAQKNYSTYDKELLAIYLAIKFTRQLLEGREFCVYTDHKPLIYAFKQKSDKASPRQIRHLQFIGQYTTDIRHINGSRNIVADTLSRINEITIPINITLNEIEEEQNRDMELKQLLNGNTTSLRLSKLKLSNDTQIFCDTSTNYIRPYLPSTIRQQAFQMIHSLSHPGARSTLKQLRSKFVWPNMNRDVTTWVRKCHKCQKAKVNKHNHLPPQAFKEVDQRFDYVHIDIIVMPEIKGYQYCLTMIDRFTRWPEIVPMKDMSADTVAKSFYAAWICRFGTPKVLTTDQGSQFESALFTSLLQMIGTKRIRTTAYHPASNGMIKRWHRSLKTALMCNEQIPWLDLLPTVLLGLRTAVKEDIGLSASEMLYGTTVRLPGEFFIDLDHAIDPEQFFINYRQYIQKFRPTPAAHHISNKIFIHPALKNCTHVWVRNDHVKKPLEPPYSGPYKIKQRISDRIYEIEMNGTTKNISVERLKPAFNNRNDDQPNKSIRTYINKKNVTFSLGGE